MIVVSKVGYFKGEDRVKVLLIRPWVNKHITTVKNFLFGEPLGIECVSTVLKELGHDVLLVDFMIEKNGSLVNYLHDFQPDMVGLTSQCTDVENIIRIAKLVKAFRSTVIVTVGGVQASCFPNSFFVKEIDYVFKSTTRKNIASLMEEIACQIVERSNKKQGPKTPLTTSTSKAICIEGIYSKRLDFINTQEFCLNEYIVPDRVVTKRYRHAYQYVGFQPCAIIQTAYGCRNKCTFCVRWKLEGAILREVDIVEIVDQIESLDEPYVMICDNDFLINENRLIQFCELLEKRRITKKYMCYGSANSILEKPDLLARLNKNGLMAVIVGYEAFDNERLKEYNKKSTVDQNIHVTRLLQENHIACWGSFIIHPDWNKADFKKLLAYIKQLKPELITFSPLVPHPLTPLYDQYEDRLIYKVADYDKWNFGDVLIYPSKMTLRAYYFQVLKLAIVVNFNTYSVNYTLKNIPAKNTLNMILGFKNLFGVYLKNMLRSLIKSF